MITLLQGANLALRFLLELCVLAALGYGGLQIGDGLFMKIGLGVGVPLFAAVLWAIFGAPGATHALPGVLHLLLEISLFGLAVVALTVIGHSTLAWALALALVGNEILLRLWGQ
ncbi:MAG: YrdB family protein [Caldilineaceae bacterium]